MSRRMDNPHGGGEAEANRQPYNAGGQRVETGDISDRIDDMESNTCDCCGYPAPLKEFTGPVTRGFGGGQGKSKFCEICASTFLSHCITYPELHGGQRLLFSSIGWIGNRLLEEIRIGRAAADGK